MRVIRSLFLLLGLASAAAGCARQPVAYVAYPTVATTSGIDGVVYGAAVAPAQPMVPGGMYAMAPNTTAGYAAAPYATTPYATAPYTAAPYVAAPYAAAPNRSGLYAYAPQGIQAAEPGYTLDSGDRLRIVVFGQDGLTNSYVVGAGGTIDLPLIGSVAARGATTDQLASRIADKLQIGRAHV